MNLYDALKIIDNQPKSADKYLWKCFSDNSWIIESYNEDPNHNYSIEFIYDTKSLMIYKIGVYDYVRRNFYYWVHPEYLQKYLDESKERGVDPDIFIDDDKQIRLEVLSDIIEKATSIKDNIEYDTRVSIDIELTEKELFDIMKAAHKKDVTLNQFIEMALEAVIQEQKNV